MTRQDLIEAILEQMQQQLRKPKRSVLVKKPFEKRVKANPASKGMQTGTLPYQRTR